MSRSKSLRGGEKKTIEIDAEDEKNIRLLEAMLTKLRKRKISKPEYESPLDKMNARPLPTKDNTITIQGRCPAPFKGCDAVSAQKVGKMCPDPRYAVFPYIQEEDTGALCYPNLDTTKIQREINDEKKAAARHSVMQLIKVLAAFNDSDASPEMCDVINKMSGEGKNKQIKQLYCENLSKGKEPLCDYTDSKGCTRKSVGSSLSLGLPAKPTISADAAASVEDKKKEVKKIVTWIRSAARVIESIVNEIKDTEEKKRGAQYVESLKTVATEMENESGSDELTKILNNAETGLNEIVETYNNAQETLRAQKAAEAAEAERIRAAESARRRAAVEAERKRAEETAAEKERSKRAPSEPKVDSKPPAAAAAATPAAKPAPPTRSASEAKSGKFRTLKKDRKGPTYTNEGFLFEFNSEDKRDFFDNSSTVDNYIITFGADTGDEDAKNNLQKIINLINSGITNEEELLREMKPPSAVPSSLPPESTESEKSPESGSNKTPMFRTLGENTDDV